MSFGLVQGTRPHDLEIKSYGLGPLAGQLRIGDKTVPIGKILTLAATELANKELIADDPRRWYAARLAGTREVDGYNAGGRRLEIPDVRQRPRSTQDVHIDVEGYALSVDDFVFTVNYVLTNTDLMPSDPRPAFIALFRTGEDAVATRPLPEAEPCPTTDRSPGTATKKSPA